MQWDRQQSAYYSKAEDGTLIRVEPWKIVEAEEAGATQEQLESPDFWKKQLEGADHIDGIMKIDGVERNRGMTNNNALETWRNARVRDVHPRSTLKGQTGRVTHLSGDPGYTADDEKGEVWVAWENPAFSTLTGWMPIKDLSIES